MLEHLLQNVDDLHILSGNSDFPRHSRRKRSAARPGGRGWLCSSIARAKQLEELPRRLSLSLSLSRQAFLRAPFSRDRLSFFSVGTLRRESPGMNARTALLPIEAYGNQSRSEVSSVAYLSRKVNEV